MINTFTVACIAILIGVFHSKFSRLFSQDEKVIEITYGTVTVLQFYCILESIHQVQISIIKALDKDVYGSIWTLCCLYLLGVPAAIVLAFKFDMGVKGLWIGMIIACAILITGELIILNCENWENIASILQAKSLYNPRISYI